MVIPRLRDRFGSHLRGWKMVLDVDGSNTCILAQHPRSLHLKPPGDGNKMVGLSDTLMFLFMCRQLGRIPASLQEIGFLFRRGCWQACLCSWCFHPEAFLFVCSEWGLTKTKKAFVAYVKRKKGTCAQKQDRAKATVLFI